MIVTGKAGQGSYGVVYVVETIPDRQPLIVKRNLVDTEMDFCVTVRELDLLGLLKGHPYIVDLTSVSFGNPFGDIPMSPIHRRGCRDDDIHFIFEKASQDFIALVSRRSRVSLSTMKKAMVQSLLAIEYAHAKGVIHRDIKPSNLLWFSDTEVAKLCDFGLSKIISEQDPGTPRVVTSWYRAPEICLSHPGYTEKSDMWSIGCVFYELLSGRALLYGAKDIDRDLFSSIVDLFPHQCPPARLQELGRYAPFPLRTGGYHREKTDHVHVTCSILEDLLNLDGRIVDGLGGQQGYGLFLDLLAHLLVIDPHLRYSATEALGHGFFREYAGLIESTRATHPPVPDVLQEVTIVAGPTRNWALAIAQNYYKSRHDYTWYRHKIIFLGLDIYDRYLHYLSQHPELQLPRVDQVEYELSYMVCLYLAMKFSLTMAEPRSFSTFVSEPYRTPSCLEAMRQFEIFLLRDVLALAIYRPTVYQAANLFGDRLSDDHVGELLTYYGRLESGTYESPRAIYEAFRGLITHGPNASMTDIPSRRAAVTPEPIPERTVVRPRRTRLAAARPMRVVDRIDYYQTTSVYGGR